MGDKQLIITGANSGIGYATAVAAAKRGYNLHLIGRNQQRLDKIQSVTVNYGVDSTTYQLDLTDQSKVAQTIRLIIDSTTQINGLINSAGIFSETNVLDYNDPTWQTIMQTNFYGTLYPTLALLPQLYRQGFGSIVNITSVDAFDGILNYAAYSASKGAVTSLTKTLAIEAATHNVRVNAIVPGVTDTEMTHERIQENITHYREKVPLQRPATADEVAEPILFLISEAATYITGQNIHVNGGWRLA
jgi:NAD(P)-dependent dehydrogenase (short-subunit alcohol dehydrogenase family)